MKGSDIVEMNINIGGEPIRLNVRFDDQISVRDAEREVKLYIDNKRKSWQEASDREILAMAAFQFAKWYLDLRDTQIEAIDIIKKKCNLIDNWNNDPESELQDVFKLQ